MPSTVNSSLSAEPCPRCGRSSSVREKLILIDEAWVPASGKDSRIAHFADLRADDLVPEIKKDYPLEQFVEGYYCETCGKGFVSEQVVKENPRFYYRR
jgi:hypothetical protein